MEHALYGAVLIGWTAAAVAAFLFLLRTSAPYGRHTRAGWGPLIGKRWGWFLQELPAPLVMALLFALGDRQGNRVAWVWLALWELHYLHRVFVYPLRLRGGTAKMPLAIVGSAIAFNVINGYLQGRYLFTLGPLPPTSWLGDPRFLGGLLLFVSGMLLNLDSDNRLFALRRGDAADPYPTPHGGAFALVTSPNYLGELIEWIGWALLTNAPAAAAFALWTAANLVPRALAHHRFYRARDPSYPPRRKAIIPFVL